MSKENKDSLYNPKEHTDDILVKLVEDLYYEYACGYVFYYHMI